ncbi:sodium-coupled monocarboxylate transporter 1-like [Penaeus japonicus]|uniref:sodium-coupled monocarboxylate transporter 1-like n=1 Tax=Penaeus japonicus TaxID=27405 RepID=UPI001C70FC02|nr:sodium-coupled monocarboxylate transporter 1-like [Penaeus japonicus]XP_042863382.1 sodium-coupled monocarboxylate transporter 1-like [Penaeus japonicus]XP_042863383.1 sodium-coupled monocarboxylate transporter 1-like [Penaeus japonicus]XP_042863384.1 sodium-coupled monocarboxylate transporter 1-like [Penaeus japonicus]
MLESEFDWSEGERGTFSWLDYVVFGGMLALSLAIGVFYAIKSRKKSNDEFLLGSSSLTCFPVSMSLLASYISAILVLGGPSEAYYHGLQWWVICIGQVALPVAAVVFMPFFYELRLTSIYEYLELRYSSRLVRFVAGGMFVIQMLLYQAVVIYAPALALASVSDFPLWASVISVGVIASVYTAIGGLKAVVWTDVLQLFILIVGLFAIIIKGLYDMGGFAPVWDIAVKYDRAGPQIFTYGFHPLQRHTVTNIAISAIVGKLSQYACTQTTVQRYASMKSLSHAYASIFLVIPFFILLISLTMIAGIVMFATYEGCDPLAAGIIDKKDQILPFYVMNRLSSVPGLPGLFVACIFSGALSTISSGVNSQAAVTWEDVFSRRPSCAKLSKTSQAWVTKFLALGYGILAMGLAFLAGHMGGVLQAAIAVTSSVAGPMLACFIMALFLPFTNYMGASASLIVGTGVALGFSFGATALGIKPELLPSPVDACPFNVTLPPPSTPPVRVTDLEYPEKLLGLSYTLLGPLGFVVALVVGILVSLITGRSRGVRVERSLVHKWVRWSLPDPSKVSARVKAHSYSNKLSTQF